MKKVNYVAVIILSLCTGLMLTWVGKIENNDTAKVAHYKEVTQVFNYNALAVNREKYKNIITKNIFTSATIQVYQPSHKKTIKPTSQVFPLDVKGILVSPESKIVMVLDIRDKVSHFMTAGEVFEDWKLDEVTNRQVVFVSSSGARNIIDINADKLTDKPDVKHEK